jgi:vancomycin aglycone glucosyltransferase
VLIPQIVDQPYWAARVAELGIGAAHDGPTPTVESLSNALRTALSPETRARATVVASTIRTDGAAFAAKLLLMGSAENGSRQSKSRRILDEGGNPEPAAGRRTPPKPLEVRE